MTTLSGISDMIDDVEEALLRTINESYNYLPTGLPGYQPSKEEIADQAYNDALGASAGEQKTQSCSAEPRSVRWWNKK